MKILIDNFIIEDLEKFIREAIKLSNPSLSDMKRDIILKNIRLLISSTNEPVVPDYPISWKILGLIENKSNLTKKLKKLGITTESQLIKFISDAVRRPGFGPLTIAEISAYTVIRHISTNVESVIQRFYAPGWKEYRKAVNIAKDILTKYNLKRKTMK